MGFTQPYNQCPHENPVHVGNLFLLPKKGSPIFPLATSFTFFTFWNVHETQKIYRRMQWTRGGWGPSGVSYRTSTLEGEGGLTYTGLRMGDCMSFRIGLDKDDHIMKLYIQALSTSKLSKVEPGGYEKKMFWKSFMKSSLLSWKFTVLVLYLASTWKDRERERPQEQECS